MSANSPISYPLQRCSGPTIVSPLNTESSTPSSIVSRWANSPGKREFIQAHSEVFKGLDEDALKKIPLHPWLSALVYTLEFPALVNRAKWEEQFNELQLDEAHMVLNFIFDHPQLVQGMDLGAVRGLDIQPWGGSFHNFDKLGRGLMEMEGEEYQRIGFDFSDHTAKEIREAYEMEVKWDALQKSTIDFTAGKVIAVLGRTVLFEQADSGKVLGCKFLRKGENLSEFCREKTITEIYNKCEEFKSQLPKPVSLTAPSNVPVDLLPDYVETENPALYVQEVDSKYYHYLHQIEDDEKWLDARKKFLFDSGLQTALGQLPPFVEMYHNEEMYRKYQPLANYIPNINKGAGRLETPFQKTRYPNAGEGGARDVGDGPHISQAVDQPTLEAHDLFKLRKGRVHYLLMNGLAKLMLVDSILLLHRLKLQKRIDWENPETVALVAGWLKEGQADILSGFTGKTSEQCSAFLDQLPIDWKQQARQMMFWAQNDDRGYPGYLETGKLPDGLYDQNMPIQINLQGAKNYVKGVGFSNGGLMDIGCYNGPLGWMECEKGWYWVSAFAVGVHLNQKAVIAPVSQPGKSRRIKPRSRLHF